MMKIPKILITAKIALVVVGTLVVLMNWRSAILALPDNLGYSISMIIWGVGFLGFLVIGMLGIGRKRLFSHRFRFMVTFGTIGIILGIALLSLEKLRELPVVFLMLFILSGLNLIVLSALFACKNKTLKHPLLVIAPLILLIGLREGMNPELPIDFLDWIIIVGFYLWVLIVSVEVIYALKGSKDRKT
jgi:predicted membrane channel-forming protein YqfA (hemolysin III family)